MPTTTIYATIVSVNPYCTHELFENGIHHIVIKKYSPETMDAYCEILDQIYTAAKPDDTVRILNESSLAPMMVSTLISRALPLVSKQRHLPQTRQALLVEGSTSNIPEALKQTRQIPRHKMGYFHANEEAQAIDWLLRDN
jgi:hypothetical protein